MLITFFILLRMTKSRIKASIHTRAKNLSASEPHPSFANVTREEQSLDVGTDSLLIAALVVVNVDLVLLVIMMLQGAIIITNVLLRM